MSRIYYIIFICTFFFHDVAMGQTIPSNRVTDWSYAGLTKPLCHPDSIYNIIDYGGNPDGVTSNDQAFQNVLNALSGNAGMIYFPSGNFHFTSTLSLSSNIVLKGSSSASTTLSFDLNGSDHLIDASGTVTGDWSPIVEDAAKGNQFIRVSNPSLFTAGDYFKLDFDDASLVLSSWAIGSVGQILLIESINSDTLFLHNPLRRNYTTSLNATAKRIDPIKNVGIECLKIERQDATNSQTSNIWFQWATECWVNAIESENCNFAHVTFDRSAFSFVNGSYFHHAFDYGSGGKAYGVMIQIGSCDIKVEDNVFEHLRHSMIVQAGANGNVFAYNYSFDPNTSGFFSDYTGDLVCHGNYPYLNLFESNINAFSIIDASHGGNGPFNTYFRNRSTLYGMQISNTSPPSDSQNIVGLEISSSGSFFGNYNISGSQQFLFGNNIQGTISPVGSNNLPDTSYYLQQLPNFLSAYQLPEIGIPNTIDSGSIPARDRALNGGSYTQNCLGYCPAIHNISLDPIPSDSYYAKDLLKSNDLIQSNEQVYFSTGNKIILQSGFSVDLGAHFESTIGTCPQ